MKTDSNNNTIFLGRGHGNEILEAIKKARRSVKIVSPYLSGSYLNELVKLHKRGVKITLITSDNLTEQTTYSKFKDSDIIKRERKVNTNPKQTKKKLRKLSLIFLKIPAKHSLSLFNILSSIRKPQFEYFYQYQKNNSCRSS